MEGAAQTRILAGLALLAVTAWSPLSGGQTALAQELTTEKVSKAKELFESGRAQFEKKKYAEALANFQESMRLVDRHSTHLWLGHCYRMLSWPDQAQTHYQRFLSLVEQHRVKIDRRVLQDARSVAESMQSVVERVELARRLRQEGQCQEALAELRWALDRSSWPEIRQVMASCYQDLRQPDEALVQITVAQGAYLKYLSDWRRSFPGTDPPHHDDVQQKIKELEGLRVGIQRPPRGTAWGRLRLQGVPGGAVVLVEGAVRGKAPLAAPLELPPGVYQVRVEREGQVLWQGRVTIQAGQETLQVIGQRTGRIRRSRPWLITGISSAVLAVGFEVVAWVAYAKGNELYTNDPDLDTYRNLTIAGHVLAGTFAVASAVSFVLWVRSGRSEPARPRPGPFAAALGILPGPERLVVGGVVRF